MGKPLLTPPWRATKPPFPKKIIERLTPACCEGCPNEALTLAFQSKNYEERLVSAVAPGPSSPLFIPHNSFVSLAASPEHEKRCIYPK